MATSRKRTIPPVDPAKEHERVQAYFDRMEPHLREIALTLRALVRSVDPDMTEHLKWGNPTYSKSGDVFWIYALAKDWVNIGFFKGAELIEFDTRHLIQGTGKGIRHIKVHSEADIDRRYLSMLMRRALVLDTQ